MARSKRMYRKNSSLSKSQAKQVRKIASKVTLENEEIKYTDSAVASDPVSAAGSLYALTDIAQGDADTQRGGDKARLVSMSWRFSFISNASALTVVCRLIFFQWHLADNVTGPITTDILQYANVVNSPYNHDNGGKFTVFYDKIHPMSYGGNNFTVKDIGHISFVKKNRRTKYVRRNLKFIAAGVTGTDMLYMLTISNTALTLPYFDGVVRVNYTDS